MNNTSRRAVQLHDLLTAFSLLTRLPVPVDHIRAGQRGAQAGWAWPLVGAILGTAAGIVAWLAGLIGLPAPVAAGIALTVLALTTGALHEDGLADCADGLGGGRDKSRALDIMKDSRIGAYGAVALMLALGVRWQTLADFQGATIIIAMMFSGAASRAAMLAAMAWMPPARSDGLSASTGQPQRMTVTLGLALGIAPIAIFAPIALIPLILLPLPLIALAMRKIDGQTGDILGGVQQLAEIGCLFGLLLALG
ncbi:cobalamin-5'-phosphate synthase [Monaibacterium marinum]|uniref:Adenosylcobinamide-GDP ribazoletransferase n=1 Tax=Pontivivens marinum TaxID=1690039 RepID=A0A2C9CLN3_9RHOB|nr:adenosylcobinamide-GDP ribazoletransferase [Monaibacterium marinum]SOH92266.1 cobalamin-5'-phosphate synthase [Monaibacterium marinum]